MHLTTTLVLIYLIWMKTLDSLSVAKIVNATYSTGSSFSKTFVTKIDSCMCSCINHPHCLSISVTKMFMTSYFCQLFATYPTKSSQLSASSTSNVTIYTNRTLSSVYISNGISLTNPTNLFGNTIDPWIPIFKLYTGNNQRFLDLNSSNLTTLTVIPKIAINQTASHWFNILISQWNENNYMPNQIALGFIVNQTHIFDFLIFNGTQSNTSSWFSIMRFISSQYWPISQYKTSSAAQTQVKSLYVDNDCVRSFNCNFKYSTSGCGQDFLGYFFMYGGYKDACIAAARNISTVLVPSIFYSPMTTYTNGKLDSFNISDGLMGFVR